MHGSRWLALVIVVVAALSVGAIGSAAAQQTTTQPIENDTDYYDNETVDPNMTEWVPGDGNATFDGMLTMLARIPGMFIGSGGLDPSGSGYVGVLMTGLVIAGAAAMATVGTGVGVVAGSMIGVVLAFGLTFVGLIPAWIRPLLLFALVGIPVARAAIGVFRG